ncbi:MAG: SURF1 family protein [Xanthobacteraceae bacterium]
MTASAKARRSWITMLIPALMVFAGLLWLGTWQIHRKAWKEGLIAELHAQLAAAPIALPPPPAWPRLERKEAEYRRVKFTAAFNNAEEALVFAAPSSFRPDVSGPGYWVFTPARLAGGAIVMVDRGFVPDGRQDAKMRPEGQIAGPVDIVGSLRWPDTRHWFTPNDEPAKNLWFSRDPQAIAAAKNLGAVAPFYVEQESPVPPGGLPKPGKLRVTLPDNHLQYALTWYGLALVLVIYFVIWAYGQRREQKAGGKMDSDRTSPTKGASSSL